MAKTPIRREQSQLLILPARQLNAALRKSAERARRLAEAFGKTVPSEPTLRAAKTARPKAPKSNPSPR